MAIEGMLVGDAPKFCLTPPPVPERPGVMKVGSRACGDDDAEPLRAMEEDLGTSASPTHAPQEFRDAGAEDSSHTAPPVETFLGLCGDRDSNAITGGCDTTPEAPCGDQWVARRDGGDRVEPPAMGVEGVSTLPYESLPHPSHELVVAKEADGRVDGGWKGLPLAEMMNCYEVVFTG